MHKVTFTIKHIDSNSPYRKWRIYCNDYYGNMYDDTIDLLLKQFFRKMEITQDRIWMLNHINVI